MQPSKPKAAATTTRPVVPWNKGAFVGPKPPLKPKQVWSIRLTLQHEGRIRDLALFDLAIDNKLRGCDLVRLHIGHSSSTPPPGTAPQSCSRKQGSPCSSS